MIEHSTLLSNPLVSPGYYFVKVISVEAESSQYLFPKLLIKLQLHPMYGVSEASLFSAIIYPASNSYYHYKNFFNTFMLGENTDDIDKAVGQWGSVCLYTSEFDEIEYSAVKFHYQPRPVMMESWRIGRDEREGSEEL